MLDLLYVLFLFLLVGYFFLSTRKEVPFLVMVYAISQYLMTQFFWMNQVSTRMSGLLLLYITLTSGVLIWGRSLQIGRELNLLKAFFRVSGWSVLLIAVLILWVKGPFALEIPEMSGVVAHVGGWQFLPVLKLTGNALFFIFVLMLILNWGERVNFRQSLTDYAPFIFYLGIIGMLAFLLPAAHGVVV